MDYKLKKDYISSSEIKNLIKQVMNIYVDGDLIDGYKYNPVDAEINFYAGLFYLTIEGYDLEDNEMFNKLFNSGVQYELFDKVKNVDIAYDLLKDTMAEMNNPLNDLLNVMKDIPSVEEMNKELSELNKEWNNVSDGYKNIINGKGDKD